MIRSRLLSATAIAAVIVTSACDGHESSVPTAPSTSATVSPSGIGASASFSKSSRRGVLHATKECSQYFGNAGDFCTITSSSLEQIEAGSRVVYATALAGGKLDSDIVLQPPGRGNSMAFGHVTLDLTASPPHGLVTFSGGTGRFKHFHATVVVSLLGDGPDWNWDGPYSFSAKDEDR
jgi:hypothetical protein